MSSRLKANGKDSKAPGWHGLQLVGSRAKHTHKIMNGSGFTLSGESETIAHSMRHKQDGRHATDSVVDACTAEYSE